MTFKLANTAGMGPGRASHVLCAALAYAIAAIDALPAGDQPASDRDDMVALPLLNFTPAERDDAAGSVARKTGRSPNLTNSKAATIHNLTDCPGLGSNRR